MKIAFICDRVNPFYFGGYEHLIYNLSQKLSEFHEVTIFTSMEEEIIHVKKVQYIKIAEKYTYVNSNGTHNIKDSIKFALKLYKSVAIFKDFDVVILNTIPYFLYGRILKKIKTKKISIFHEAWFNYLKETTPLLRYLLPGEIQKIVDQSNVIIAVSFQTKNSLINNYKAHKVERIPIGIKTDAFERKLDYKYDIIYMGRIARIKHIDILINSVKLLKQEMPDIKVIICGYGDQLRNLISLTRELKLENNIEFSGKFDEDDKYNLLRRSKIFVLPSEREGYSISTLEAMFCGAVPIVAEPKYEEVFGCSDFVLNNKSGLYFQMNNIVELKEKILYLLKNDEFRNYLKYNAQEIANQYDWKSILKKYEDVLNSLVKAP